MHRGGLQGHEHLTDKAPLKAIEHALVDSGACQRPDSSSRLARQNQSLTVARSVVNFNPLYQTVFRCRPTHSNRKCDTRPGGRCLGIGIHFAILGAHMLLSEAREGQSVVIERIGGQGALRRRLHEMGILKGTEVTIEKYAPLKDPMELVVKGYHVSLRVEEAARISVLDVKTGLSSCPTND
jgi:Fe2+ transport system protein FeoA